MLFIVMTAFACAKDGDSSPISITGTWTFRSQISGGFHYPVNNTQPGWNEAYAGSVNISSCNCNWLYIKFDNLGNYVLTGPFGQPPVFASGNNLPPATPPVPVYGTYKVINDNILVVQPDTSFLKSTYAYRTDFPFPNGDTIRLKKINTDSLQFIQQWTAGYRNFVSDSIIQASYLSISGFKKIQ